MGRFMRVFARGFREGRVRGLAPHLRPRAEQSKCKWRPRHNSRCSLLPAGVLSPTKGSTSTGKEARWRGGGFSKASCYSWEKSGLAAGAKTELKTGRFVASGCKNT